MCVQPTFIIGTYNEDGQPNFAPITWVSVTYEEDDYLIVISMYGGKQTKKNVMRTKQLSINLASVDMLELVDYFGNSSLKRSGKNPVSYSYTASEYVYAPLLEASRWVYECEVSQSVKTGESNTFFCRIKNVQIDENIELEGNYEINLIPFEPIIYSGHYHSLGKHLGRTGDFNKKKEETD